MSLVRDMLAASVTDLASRSAYMSSNLARAERAEKALAAAGGDKARALAIMLEGK